MALLTRVIPQRLEGSRLLPSSGHLYSRPIRIREGSRGVHTKAVPSRDFGNKHASSTCQSSRIRLATSPLYSASSLHYTQPMRLLALDPALRSSGFAILEKREQKIRSLAYGVIQIRADVPMAQCLVEIHRQVSDLIELHQPEGCAVESVIFVQNSRTAVTLGAARGSALLAAAQRGLNIFEYPPKRVKQAVVGTGSAQKSQVGFMVRALLGLTENPQS